MGYVYVPESWRKKFKVGQTVWYLDHFNHKIMKGKFDKYEPYEHEYSDAVWIKNKRYGFETSDEILESWTFSKRSSADRCLKGYLKQGVKQKRSELKNLENKLKELK